MSSLLGAPSSQAAPRGWRSWGRDKGTFGKRTTQCAIPRARSWPTPPRRKEGAQPAWGDGLDSRSEGCGEWGSLLKFDTRSPKSGVRSTDRVYSFLTDIINYHQFSSLKLLKWTNSWFPWVRGRGAAPLGPAQGLTSWNQDVAHLLRDLEPLPDSLVVGGIRFLVVMGLSPCLAVGHRQVLAAWFPPRAHHRTASKGDLRHFLPHPGESAI